MKYVLVTLNVLLLLWLLGLSRIIPMTSRLGAAAQIRELSQAGVINASAARNYLEQTGSHAEKWELALADCIGAKVGNIHLFLIPTACVLLVNITIGVYFRREKKDEQRDPTTSGAVRR